MVTGVPASLPGKLAGLGLLPVTVMVKFEARAVPPLSLMTCLITLRVAAWSLLVTVQVLVSPAAIDPVQSAERLEAEPSGPLAPTEEAPALMVTMVPASAPGELAGVVLVLTTGGGVWGRGGVPLL